MIFFSPLVKNKDQKAGEMAQQSRVHDALTQDSGSGPSIHKATHNYLKLPFQLTLLGPLWTMYACALLRYM